MKEKFGRELWVFMSTYGSGSKRVETDREAFRNYLDDCLQSYGANVSIKLLDKNASVGDEVGW